MIFLIFNVFSGLWLIMCLNGKKKKWVLIFFFDLICGIKVKKKEKIRSVIIFDIG